MHCWIILNTSGGSRNLSKGIQNHLILTWSLSEHLETQQAPSSHLKGFVISLDKLCTEKTSYNINEYCFGFHKGNVVKFLCRTSITSLELPEWRKSHLKFSFLQDMNWTLGRIVNHKFFQAISLCAELYVGPNIKPGRAPNWWVTEDRRRRIINLGVHYRVSECILLHLAIWWCQPSITKQVELRKNHDLEEDPANSLFTIFLSCYRRQKP